MADYTEPVGESVDITEAFDALQAHLAEPLETVAVAEGYAAQLGALIDGPESVSVSEAFEAVYGGVLVDGDTVSVVDGLGHLATFQNPVEETVSVVDHATVSSLATLMETVVVNETTDYHQTFAINLAETVALTELLAASQAHPPVFANDTVLVTDAMAFAGGHSIPLAESVTIAEGVQLAYAGSVGAIATVSVLDAVATNAAFFRGVAETVVVLDAAFTEGAASAAPITSESVQVFAGTEIRLEGLADTGAFQIHPEGEGVPVVVRSVTPIQTVRETGGGGRVEPGGFRVFLPFTSILDVGDYLSLEGARYTFEDVRIAAINNIDRIVLLDRRVSATDPNNGDLAWTVKKAPIGVTLEMSEATAGVSYRIVGRQLVLKHGGVLDVSATFVSVAPDPVTETYETDPLTGSITITFSKSIAVDPVLLQPSLFSISGPSVVRVTGVSMPSSTQVLVRTTPTFVTGSYSLAFPPLRDRALNRIGV